MFFFPYEICCFLIRFPISSNRMRKPQTPQKLESSPTSSQDYTGTIQRTSWRKSAPVSVSFVYCIWRTNRVSNLKPEPKSTTPRTRNEWGIFGISRYAHLNQALRYAHHSMFRFIEIQQLRLLHSSLACHPPFLSIHRIFLSYDIYTYT